MNERMPPRYNLPALLTLSSRAMIDELHRRLAAIGFDDLRPAHGFAFARLVPDGATGNELAEHLGVSKQAASQLADYLEARGYVARRPHPRDGRGKIIVLTPRGWDSLRASELLFAEIEERWAAIIGADRMAALQDDLQQIVDAERDDDRPRRLRPVW